ncbi:unnamed protein product [Oikopleura dioica]|uniref:Uncharacterized protein n=1 Tax=Oikopleura dioica TaxID=34765 RepID=E4Y417_OIKDI|nr:unnamed protein product [Oikopleura dioica]
MFGKKKSIPEPSGMIVNTAQPSQPIQPGQPSQPQYQIIDRDAMVPTTGFFDFNTCGKLTLAAPFWSFIMDFQRLGTMIYLYTKPDIDLGIGWTSYITVHLILRMIIMYCKVPAIKAVSWTVVTKSKEKLICVDFQTKEMKEAGGYMQFAAVGNWILLFLGQAWFFLTAYGQFEIFPTIFIVTILIDIYLHLCEVRAAEFMKNKGAHWRNSCSGFFCGIDNAVDPETVVALDDPRIQKALEKRSQGGVHPKNDA